MDADTYVVNVDGAVVRDGAYLLIERSADEEHAAGLLGFPGGTLEGLPDGDAIERTVARELREEVGLDVDRVEYVFSSTFATDDGTPCLNVVALCDRASGEARVRAPAEVAAIHWLTPEEMDRRDDVPPFTRRYVDRIEAHRGAD